MYYVDVHLVDRWTREILEKHTIGPYLTYESAINARDTLLQKMNVSNSDESQIDCIITN